jgi:hypothetical protein
MRLHPSDFASEIQEVTMRKVIAVVAIRMTV